MDDADSVVDVLTGMGLTEDQIRAVMSLWGSEERRKDLTSEMEFSEKLIQPQDPRGYMIRGRQFGPGPWSQAAAGLQQGLATAERLKARKLRQQELERARKIAEDYAVTQERLYGQAP